MGYKVIEDARYDILREKDGSGYTLIVACLPCKGSGYMVKSYDPKIEDLECDECDGWGTVVEGQYPHRHLAVEVGERCDLILPQPDDPPAARRRRRS